MTGFFSSGRVVDVALALMLLELLAVLVFRGRAATLRPLDFIVNLGAGAGLMLALRTALRGSPWQPVALWLLIALAFHVWDLWLRGAAAPRPAGATPSKTP